ncbi:hypothetical protein IDM30_15410 [Acinetobacter seifertii]|nr:hypothetical protein [Acinetobacter seifertii]
MTSRPSNLRGRQGRVILDEAAFHESLDELLKAALALLIWGGCVRVISTHDGEDNPFNELINEIRAGKRKGTVHRTTFRDAVAQGLINVFVYGKILPTMQMRKLYGYRKFMTFMVVQRMKSWMLFQVKVVVAGCRIHCLRVRKTALCQLSALRHLKVGMTLAM